jgi:hypothetical protein
MCYLKPVTGTTLHLWRVLEASLFLSLFHIFITHTDTDTDTHRHRHRHRQRKEKTENSLRFLPLFGRERPAKAKRKKKGGKVLFFIYFLAIKFMRLPTLLYIE